MKHLTFEVAEEASKCCDYAFAAAGTKENPINWGDAAGFYLSGYNTACDLAEKEIAELKKHYETAIDLCDTWIARYNQLKLQSTCDNPSQVELSIADLIKRVEKLEAFGITDGSKIRIGSFSGTVTKIR